MNILVTGGSGFIGTRLIYELQQIGIRVVNYDLKASAEFPSITTIGDVRDGSRLLEASNGMDAIIHLAAEHRDDLRPKTLYYDVNVDGARRSVEAAEAVGIKTIVFTSSVAIYGLDVGIPHESCEPRPFNDYGQSKLEAERIFLEWAERDPAHSLVVVRPSVVFGESNRGNVYVLLKQVNTRRFVLIGDAQNKKSMSYVLNISNFLCSTINFGPGVHVFNYADTPDLTTQELIDTVCQVLGSPRPIRIPYLVGIVGGHVFDMIAAVTKRSFPISAVRVRKFCASTQICTDRLQSTGWCPKFTLREGLQRTITHEFGSLNVKHRCRLPRGGTGEPK